MVTSPDSASGTRRVFPRRAFIAAALSATIAGTVSGLGVLGALSTPHREQFQFSRGTTFAVGERDRLRGHLARALADARMQVIILGHSGTAGETAANMTLSLARAETAAALARELGITHEQITVTGVGGANPLTKDSDESDRAYQSRLARVDVTLQLRR